MNETLTKVKDVIDNFLNEHRFFKEYYADRYSIIKALDDYTLADICDMVADVNDFIKIINFMLVTSDEDKVINLEDDTIGVGDEVLFGDKHRGVVLGRNVNIERKIYHVKVKDDGIYVLHEGDITKTGRHFDAIEQSMNELSD